MVKFDIITPTVKAYRISWAERQYLARLVVIPLLLKIGGYMSGFSMGYQDNQIGLTLCLLPAYFAEGWMLSHFVRLIMLGHRWPFRPSGNFEADIRVLRTRARGVMSGLISYVIINMALGAVMAAMLTSLPDPSQNPESVPPQMALALIMILAAFIWLFRLTWLYIPLALNQRADRYLEAVNGYLTSLPMIGVWILCVVPFILAVQLVGGVLSSAGGSLGGILVIILLVVVDTLKNIVATAGLTYLIQDISQKRGKHEDAV